MQTFSKIMPSSKEAMQFFEDIPYSTYFKIYVDEDTVPSGMFITHFMEEGDEIDTDFNADAVISGLQQFMPDANNLNSEGVIYEFDKPRKLCFYIKDVTTPFKIYIETE